MSHLTLDNIPSKTMTTPQQDAAAAVNQMLANAQDNLHRASMRFGNFSRKQLDAAYGESESTPRQIIQGYQDEIDRWKRAAEFVEGGAKMMGGGR